MIAKKVIETINFERRRDPKKYLGIGRLRPYPSMGVNEFREWFHEEILPNLDEDEKNAISDNLIMNDFETDDEVYVYLKDRIKNEKLVRDLIEMRGYFNDRNYIIDLFKNDL
ncbi:MAG TPA: hypothetical protein P5513_08140 [Candidatus Diapherotrites archaeon]|mgnify:CR=1 FL=1|nr:hypothetical protein [Candidatus Diapherotrites archaeon]